jgi:hypothetical protein
VVNARSGCCGGGRYALSSQTDVPPSQFGAGMPYDAEVRQELSIHSDPAAKRSKEQQLSIEWKLRISDGESSWLVETLWR